MSHQAGAGLREHLADAVDGLDRRVDDDVVDRFLHRREAGHAAARRQVDRLGHLHVDDVAGDDAADARRRVREQRLMLGAHRVTEEADLDAVVAADRRVDVGGEGARGGVHGLRHRALAERPRGKRDVAVGVRGRRGGRQRAAARRDREGHRLPLHAAAVRVDDAEGDGRGDGRARERSNLRLSAGRDDEARGRADLLRSVRLRAGGRGHDQERPGGARGEREAGARQTGHS
jgi:hypothetical protein